MNSQFGCFIVIIAPLVVCIAGIEKHMPTIKDVAREAGVSIATVSYVLNNKTESISEDTCRSVIEAAERIGYTPNVTARNLRFSRTGLIGYAWHDVPDDQVNPILDRFAYYLAREAEAAGYHLLTFTYPPDNPLPVYDEFIRTGRVDGFVLAGTQAEDKRIQFLMEQRIPFVSFGRSNPDWDFAWVDTDGQRGIREAVEYLIDLGHRRIAMIAWPEGDLVGKYRLRGYMDALQNAGIPVRPDYIVRGQHGEQLGRDAVARLMSLPQRERPTALVAISDLEAVSAMNEAEGRGLEVGKDLSIVGFDDVPLSQYLRPALTTLQQPIHDIGQSLIAMLRKMLAQKGGEKPKLLVPPKLIVRDSCGAPR
jgi:DNA-binding LacI/PurR family transcriptional regulator